MRMRNLLKHSDELSSSSVMCIESKMEAQSRYSYLARVEKELKALHKAQESVLVLNYYNLREFPDVLLCDEHCRKRLRKLYLKRNLITSLVRKCKLAPCLFLRPLPPSGPLIPSSASFRGREVSKQDYPTGCMWLSMCVHIYSMQSPETRHLEALTELYLHSNNLTQLPSGRPAMVGLVSHSRKGLAM